MGLCNTIDDRWHEAGQSTFTKSRLKLNEFLTVWSSGVPRGGLGVFKPPPPEILKALQNRAKLNPICENLKIAEFRTPTHQDVRKKCSKILKLPRFANVLH